MFNKNQSSFLTMMIIPTLLMIQMACAPKTVSDLGRSPIIPRPVSVAPSGDLFTIAEGVVVYFQGGSAEVEKTARFLAERLRLSTGFAIEVKEVVKPPRSGIYLTFTQEGSNPGGDESYELMITKKLITLSAGKPEGLFRGIQTIRQLLPAKVEMNTKQEGPWEIATGTITDYPVYQYRGAMLDVARHFFSIEEVKRFIDYITLYKINVLHLHLSDDQGWRIEIKSWPNLTTHGGTTEVGGGSGGYYTQEQFTDLIKYAGDRYMTVVPEIDMPGHTNAALSSYAELNCNGKATELYTGTEVGFSTLCTDKEITYKFVDDVVREISALAPGPYFHMGGDESHVTKIEDYIPFVNRVQEIVNSHGKNVIGWDEIALSALRPNTVAQHWANVRNANLAVGQGAKILMSPAAKAYMDMQYDKDTPLGLHWAAYIEIDSAYIWDPATFTPGIEKEDIIGIEAALWSETVTNLDEVEYMVFPRLPGYAEIGWTPASARNWDEYKYRLAQHGKVFEAMDINFYKSKLVPWDSIK